MDDAFFLVNPFENKLLALGLSAAELSELMNVKSIGIILKDGVAYDKDGHQLVSTERGKLTWAVKTLKKGFKKLPRWARNVIETTGISSILNFIEHYTGTLEDAIYKNTRNKFLAWSVSKTIMLVIF